ncbi:MAG: ABC transporter substrate-binding protein [Alphaproteobacteria bacterium]|nr:ABC transporter substrate-binding protein [Alphaproteobacteria bacterium]
MSRRSFIALAGALALAGVVGVSPACAQQPLKIALIYSKTGPLEAYARQTEAGFMLGLEYATKGTMMLAGRKIEVILKDDQFKPDLAKAALEQAYGDDKVDIAVGTTGSAGALAMLPIAEEYKKVLIVEPAVADQITGEKWNRYIFRTARNSTQDALAAAATLKDENISIATLAQDYAFGKDGVAAVKAALAAVGSKAKIVHEEYAPQATTDFTAPAQRIFDALKDRPGRKIIVVVWAGAHPLPKLMDLKPERYKIEIAPGGNILPVMAGWKQFPGLEGAIYYYWGFPKNPVNDWLVAEYKKKNNGAPPDFFVAGGMSAAMALVEAVNRAKGTDTEKLIAAMEGMSFDTPKGKMTFRKEDHQALQPMYHWRMKANPAGDTDLLDLVREIPADEMVLPIKNKR